MKKKYYYGKFILRGGDLLPEEINEALYRRYNLSFFEDLDRKGFIFKDRKEAATASTNAIALILGIKDGTYVREEDIAEAYPPKKRIYISGPITGYKIGERRIAFKKAQLYCEKYGYNVFNPMENGLPSNAPTHEHMRCDIEGLLTCDAILMMRRWIHSKGCQVEFEVATSIGLPVFFEESDELIKFE